MRTWTLRPRPPESVRTVWRESPFVGVSSLHAEAHGTLRELSVRTRVSVGSGNLDAVGVVSLGDPTRVTLQVEAQSVDAHALSASAPPSVLSATGRVSFTRTASGHGVGEAQLELDGGTVGAAHIPPSTVHVEISHDDLPASRTRAHATLSLREPGAPTTISVTVEPLGPSLRWNLDATTDVPGLDALARIGPSARGHARARAHGTVDVGADRIDAQLTAVAGDLTIPGFGVRDARLAARVAGSLESPSIDATLDASGIAAGAVHFQSAHATARGVLPRGSVAVSLRGDADARAEAKISLINRAVTLSDLRIAVDDRGEHFDARAKRVTVSDSDWRVEQAKIGGFGAPLFADVRAHSDTLDVRAHGDGLDVGRIAKLGRVALPAAGQLAVDVDASVRHDGARGRALLDLSGGALGNWRDATLHVDAVVDGHRGSGRLTARLADIGSLEVHSPSLELGATDPLSFSSWRRAWGAVDFGATIDLGRLAERLSSDALPMTELSGAFDMKGRVERDSVTDATPDVNVTAHVTGLSMKGREPATWHLEGLATTAHVQVDGDTGATALAVEVADGAGVLVTLGATSDAVPYDRLTASADDVESALESMPFDATVRIPERDMGTLPPIFQGAHVKGSVGATIAWRGTAVLPVVDATAYLRHAETDVTLLTLPVDAELSAHYDGRYAAATIAARARRHDVLEVGTELALRARDVLGGLRGAPIPWSASARAELSNFPLQSVSALDEHRVRGSLSGRLTFNRLHEDASATLALAVDKLSVGDVACKSGTVKASIDGNSLEATVRVVEEAGSADLGIRAGSHWGSALEPSFDRSRPAEVTWDAVQFRPALLLPFVSSVLAQLDGEVDGHASAAIDPASGSVKAQGTVKLKKGVVEFASVGGEFHDVSASIGLTPDGLIRVGNVSARGLSGLLEGAATARFDGLAFGGTRAQIQIPRKCADPPDCRRRAVGNRRWAPGCHGRAVRQSLGPRGQR